MGEGGTFLNATQMATWLRYAAVANKLCDVFD